MTITKGEIQGLAIVAVVVIAILVGISLMAMEMTRVAQSPQRQFTATAYRVEPNIVGNPRSAEWQEGYKFQVDYTFRDIEFTSLVIMQSRDTNIEIEEGDQVCIRLIIRGLVIDNEFIRGVDFVDKGECP